MICFRPEDGGVDLCGIFSNFALIIKSSNIMILSNVNLPVIPTDRPISVLFVCLGNICRSPAAEEILRSMTEGSSGEWVVDSAGTGRYHIGQLPDRRMRVHARQRGYDLTHHCRQVDIEDFEDFDLIIGMDAQNVRDLLSLAPDPEAMKKVAPIGRWLDRASGYDYVPDPYYEGQEGFELVIDLLEGACRRIADEKLPDGRGNNPF